MAGDEMTALGEWLDCQCPECGSWFPVVEISCPNCGAGSTCLGCVERPVDEEVDALLDEMETEGSEWVGIEGPPALHEEAPGVEPQDPPRRGSSIARKLRSLFM